MAEELVRNPWGIIVRDGELLELRWLPSTAQMSDGGFMATLCLFAWEAEQVRPRGLLIDAREFRHRFGDGVMAWRDAHIIPRYTELHTSEPQRARAFYGDLLGWTYSDVPGPTESYAFISGTGGMVGGIASSSGAASSWLPYISVADVGAMTAKAKALGAAIEVDCQAFGGLGTLSVIRDPTGARVGLWQEARSPA
jgi:predicted enzyme related to lactoylglutathione lyase